MADDGRILECLYKLINTALSLHLDRVFFLCNFILLKIGILLKFEVMLKILLLAGMVLIVSFYWRYKIKQNKKK